MLEIYELELLIPYEWRSSGYKTYLIPRALETQQIVLEMQQNI